MKIGLIMIGICLCVCLNGCGNSKFREGACFQNIKDGFVWRVVKVGFNEITIQGLFDGKWGILVSTKGSVLESDYVKIECPFTTQTLANEGAV